MSITAKLHVEGTTYNVIWFNYGLKQKMDETGRPSATPLFSGLQVVVEATRDNLFFDKAVHPTENVKEIILEYVPNLLGSKTRRISFFDCHVVINHTSFISQGDSPMSESLLITAGGVKDSASSTEYSAFWRKTFAAPVSQVGEEEKGEPIIETAYFTTIDGVKIQQAELHIGSEVYYVIESKNAVGETIDLSFSDSMRDFIFQGEVIPNDYLEGVKITSDRIKLKLEVVRDKSSNIG
ncbi:hypothetical protein LVD15_11200 [Fulvivirga maritima]|uniref:type VI secretion system tube protein TssD n=1 Tax=Fulvivirga maritima TaxID=2904247 RepID=UPI001F3FDC4B|nr:type VI secretion system tube protein TssD [Fulvivirga maritima]UII28963.1 hypothetical protein LVD15_11200 [Fulvivirga maritima]